MVKFRSKQSVGLILFLTVLLGAEGILMIYIQSTEGLLIVTGVAIFIIHMFSTTNYRIDGKNLKIKCGLFTNILVDIDTLRRISESNNPISSPATSLDRLELKYQKNNKIETVLISPKDKEGFIKMVTEINPKIEVRLKPKK